MKTLTTLLLTFTTFIALASGPISEAMKGMGLNLKPLNNTLIRKTHSVPLQELAVNAREISRLAREADQHTPTTATTPELALEYHQIMNELFTATDELALALDARNEALATEILRNRVLAALQKGHEKFRE